jgi:cell division protein FtsI/penicillin-binding protein 2
MDFKINKRINVLKYLFTFVFIVFVVRLIDLQIFDHDKYETLARDQHQKRFILPAQRGKIMVRKNMLVDEYIPLATNNTLKMLFVDPLILAYPRYNPREPLENQERGSPEKAAELMAPLLINAHCEEIEGCTVKTDPNEWTDIERKIIKAYQKELEVKFRQLERREVILVNGISEDRAQQITKLNLSGIEIIDGNLIADPTLIRDPENTAEELSILINIKQDTLAELLKRRQTRYIPIERKITPAISAKILELKENPEYRYILRGVQLQDEQWRYYPERSLAAQVIGFVNNNGIGQYGIEGRFNDLLAGKTGVIFGATNTRGQQILGKDYQFSRAQNGSDILLSIDRVIQGQLEKILAEDTKQFDADAGQIIVIEPKTGRILAMVHSPTFDPNEYTKAFSRYEISPEQNQLDEESETFNRRIPTIETEDGKYFRYFNTWGPQVFRNRIIADTYEPGSVMKALTIAAAIESQEITPQTVFNDQGPIEVDEFRIRNSDDTYAGWTSMVSVLSRSLNTGIAFITQKMGPKLLYTYLKDFGFGEYTDIELDGEESGILEFWDDWTESELVTRGFGQGLTSTPLQMAMAFSSLANGGYIMKPLLVEEIRHANGEVETFHPQIIKRVLGTETYNTTKAMLLHAVEKGIARASQVYGYTVMGKTGTSQTYRNGKAQEGAGTTITSYAGFGPLKDPRFVILVKYDYPKSSQWGSETAAITFRKVAEFLFQHMGIPPDK